MSEPARAIEVEEVESTRARRDVRADRLSLVDPIFSVAEAARLLPWRKAEAIAWLEREGLIIRRPGLPAPVVRWRDVVAAMPEELQPEPVRRPAGGTLPMKKLKTNKGK